MADTVCIFWNNSNIYIAGQIVAGEREGALVPPQL